MKSPRFSLMDLVVIVGVSALGVMVLMPAVARARAQARASSCRNNLMQLGLALHNYHDVFNVFPMGRVWEPDPKRPQHDNGAASMLLPFIEQSAVYNGYNFSLPWTGPANKTTRQQRLEQFLCPEDRRSTVTASIDPSGQPTNYAFNLGAQSWLTQAKRENPDQGPAPEGVFFDNSHVGIRDIIDGTANTVMVAEQLIDRPRRDGSPEKTGDCSGNATDGKQYFERTGTRWITGHPSSGYYNARRTPNHPEPDCFDISASGIASLNKVPRSHHEGGVNLLMGDGTVRSAPNSIDLAVWQALNTRAGREQIDLDAATGPVLFGGGTGGTGRSHSLPKPPALRNRPAPSAEEKRNQITVTGLGVEGTDSGAFFGISLQWPSEGVKRNYRQFLGTPEFKLFFNLFVPTTEWEWPPDALALVPQGEGAFLVFRDQTAIAQAGPPSAAAQELPTEVTFRGKLRGRGVQNFLLRCPAADGQWKYLPLEVDFAAATKAEGLADAWAEAQVSFLESFPAPPDQSFFAYAREIASARGGLSRAPVGRGARADWGQPGGRDRFYEITTGALALQESLQLDRMRNPGHDSGPRSIPVESIPGVAVRSHPWTEMIGDKKPAIEPIADLIPEDNYYVRFRTTRSLKNFLEFLEGWGGSVLSHLEVGGRDYGVREKVEQQICMRSSLLADLLGPAVIESLAITGSDPYLREGSDLSVVFRLKAPVVFETAVKRYIDDARKQHPDLAEGRDEYRGATIQSFTTPDQVVRCYRVRLGEYYVYSNSPVAVRRIIDTQRGEHPSLAKSLDFVFMRTLHASDAAEEDGFVFLSDPFIRSLAGPRLRIAEKRRIEAVTSLEMIKNAALFYLWEHPGAEVPTLEQLQTQGCLPTGFMASEPGDRITWNPKSFTAGSERYGRLGHLTPAIELPIDKVTAVEKGEYDQFRNRYQNYWRQYFDPIGIRITARQDMSIAMTILPLIDNSEYNSAKDLLGGTAVELEPLRRSGPVAIHLTTHLNPESQELKNFQTMALSVIPGQNRAVVEWIGERLEFWVEDSDAFLPLLRDQKFGRLFKIPMVLAVEVKNPVGLAALLVGLRGMVQTSAPNLILFEPLDAYRDFGFTRIRPAPGSGLPREEFGDAALYYGAVGNYFYLSTSIDSLHRIVDQFADSKEAKEKGQAVAKGPGSVAQDFGGAANAHMAMRFNLSAMKESRPALDYYFGEQAWEVERGHLRNLWLAVHTVGLGPNAAASPQQVLGYGIESALGNSYRFDAAHDEVVGSTTGSLWNPTARGTLPENSPLEQLIRGTNKVRATLEFTRDGLHTELTVRRGAE